MPSTEKPQWFDRGRARWRSRPEKKARSYEESVGGSRRPERLPDGGARRDVRVALALYARGASGASGMATDDVSEAHTTSTAERLLDRAASHRSNADTRWRHSVLRRERIARMRYRRAMNHGRRFEYTRVWLVPFVVEQWCRRCPPDERFTAYDRLELVRAACDRHGPARAWRGWRPSVRTIDSLCADGDFARAIDAPVRRTFAYACLRARQHFLAHHSDEAFVRMLEALAHDDGRLAPLYAQSLREREGRFDKMLAYYDNFAREPGTTFVGRMRRLLSRDAALAERISSWLARHAA